MAILRVFDYFERGGIELEFAGNEIVTNACPKGESIDKFCFAYDRWNDDILFGKDAKNASPVWCVEVGKGEKITCEGDGSKNTFLYFVSKDAITQFTKLLNDIEQLLISKGKMNEQQKVRKLKEIGAYVIIFEDAPDDNLMTIAMDNEKEAKSIAQKFNNFPNSFIGFVLDLYRGEIVIVHLEVKASKGNIHLEIRKIRIPLSSIYWASDIKGYIG